MFASLAVLIVALAVLIGLGVWYSIVFPRQPVRGPLPPLTAAERDLSRRLEAHVSAIARTPHNVDHYEALEAAAHTIETTLASFGYATVPQTYTAGGKEFRNIEVVIEPKNGDRAAPSLVVGAHYDSAGASPGANDNGTGVAALLEIARLIKGITHGELRLRLVFWVNEEQPYSHTPDMGSFRHAKQLHDSGEAVAGAISLETLGHFSDVPGSQKFPAPFGLIYSDRGNFVAFVGLPGSRPFVHRALGAFRRETHFPSIGGVAPGFIRGIDNSDHWAYAQFGYPALMVTDTAPFRNPQYHLKTDLPGTVDYESLARVTAGVERMLRDLVK